jgi:electron transfer flavoprotein beta subunit
VRIVVLTKPVPDPAAGTPRLGPDGRLDRTTLPAVVNGNDEYALEAALKLTESHGGEITLLAMAPGSAPETLRKGLAMGAHRAIHVTDPALEGSCTLSTARVLAAALRTLEYDLVLGGVDTSDGTGGVVAPAVATLLGLPYLSYAARIVPDPDAGRVRVERLAGAGREVLEAPLPALISCTQVLGEPRYPSLKGIMGARTKEVAALELATLELGDGPVGGTAATTRLVESWAPPPRGPTQVGRAPAAEAAAAIAAFLTARRLI